MENKWDGRFLGLAREISTWSKDPSTQVGAVITRPDKTIVSQGFNGFPKSMSDNSNHLNTREEKYSRIIHGEMNALIHANTSVQGCTLYTWPLAPCDRCTVHMIQAGITRFVFPQTDNERWVESINRSKGYMQECGCSYTEVE